VSVIVRLWGVDLRGPKVERVAVVVLPVKVDLRVAVVAPAVLLLLPETVMK